MKQKSSKTMAVHSTSSTHGSSSSSTASTSGSNVGSITTTATGQSKRKEIYKYVAPWTIYAMSWSIRHDKRFRLAIGSYIEEYNNKV